MKLLAERQGELMDLRKTKAGTEKAALTRTIKKIHVEYVLMLDRVLDLRSERERINTKLYINRPLKRQRAV